MRVIVSAAYGKMAKTDPSGSASVEGTEDNFYTDTNIFYIRAQPPPTLLTTFCALFPVPIRQCI